MYERYSALGAPERSQQSLWRYMREDRLLDLLQSRALHFTHLPAFSDRLEGLLTRRARDQFIRWRVSNGSAPDVARMEAIQYENHRDDLWANCWHASDHESYLMWKAYAERGYAIRTTYERMQAAFDEFDGCIGGGMVEYADFSREAPPIGNVFGLAVTKDMPYRDEREFRLLYWRVDPRNVEHPASTRGVPVQVDLRMLVDRVYVSPLVGEPSPAVSEALARLQLSFAASALLLAPD